MTEEPVARYREIASIPIAFEVRREFEVRGNELVEQPVTRPWIKDYDSVPGNSPSEIAAQLDLSKWGLLFVRIEGRLVGAAAVAVGLPGQRDDVAILWDLRVAPDRRRCGIGTALFTATEGWARSRGFGRLEVETQNINVAACRFYERQGCALCAVERDAYPALPGEIKLIWGKGLGPA